MPDPAWLFLTSCAPRAVSRSKHLATEKTALTGF